MKSLNILVLGGTGRTGRHIIQQALQAQYNVRALTRNLSKIPKFAEGDVDWIQGDSTDPQAIKKAIEGQDMILSVVGPKWIGKTTLYSDTIKAIISATKNNSRSPTRFLGVTANWDLSLSPWYHKLMAKFMTGMKEDHVKMEDILEKEGGHLQWTVIRPFELKEHEKTGTYIVLPENHSEKILKLMTYTGDLADFMLGEAFDNKWVHKRVTVCYRS